MRLRDSANALLPKRLRHFVIPMLAILALLLAACGGAAKREQGITR